MASTLWPEMAHSLFQPLLGRLGQDRQEEDFAPQEVRELLFGCGMGAAVLDRLREMLQDLLGRGLESRKVSFLQKEFLDVVELALSEVYPKARTIVTGSTLSEAERASSLETLDEFTARASAVRNELKELHPWLERPAPEVDLTKIIGNATSGDYEGYVDTADLEP